jgi:hypothetical protein
MTPGQDANSIDKPVFYLLENDLLRFVISYLVATRSK